MHTRKKRLAYNTISSLIYQITTIVCGFILPRLILTAFGSDVNGLVNSITQFLGIISFLELGVGAVVQSSLYKPLAEHNEAQVSRIVKSANRFFRTIAGILLVYVIFLLLFYPTFAKQSFGYGYTATLILVISISSFAQYYFGIVNRLLLTADQHGYVQYSAQTVAVILNTTMCFVLIKLGCGIQMVKLTTFASLSAVSIYSVYYLVVKGVKQLFLSMTNGIQSLMGELWARGNEGELKELFAWTEWVIHTGTIFVFGVAAITVVPFVEVYTKGVTDADYMQPLFAALLVAANAGHCLRLPYNLMILAAGHYKETQRNYIVAAVLNIVISVLVVSCFGLIGVAIGTLIAMCYQTVWMAWYDSKHLIKWPMRNFLKQVLVDALTVVMMVLLTMKIQMPTVNYRAWVCYAIAVSVLAGVSAAVVNTVFYRENMLRLWKGAADMVSRWFDRAASGIFGGYKEEVNSLVSMMKGRCAYAC